MGRISIYNEERQKTFLITDAIFPSLTASSTKDVPEKECIRSLCSYT